MRIRHDDVEIMIDNLNYYIKDKDYRVTYNYYNNLYHVFVDKNGRMLGDNIFIGNKRETYYFINGLIDFIRLEVF